MKLRSDCHLYAVGMKGWVELRVAKKPPKATVSTCSKTIQISVVKPGARIVFNGVRYVYETTIKPQKIVLKTTTWDGGRVVGSMADRRFRLLAGMAARNGACCIVPAGRVNTILREVDHA